MRVIKQPLKYDCVIESPIGKLGIKITNDEISKIVFLSSQSCLIVPKSITSRQVAAKIKRYFNQPKQKFDLSMCLNGTLLQKKIWGMLQRIPSGKTLTYGDLAKRIQTSPRVIGNACRSNPLPIIIPCHRVVAATGLGGYCGKADQQKLKIKRWLLAHEGAICN